MLDDDVGLAEAVAHFVGREADVHPLVLSPRLLDHEAIEERVSRQRRRTRRVQNAVSVALEAHAFVQVLCLLAGTLQPLQPLLSQSRNSRFDAWTLFLKQFKRYVSLPEISADFQSLT